MSAKTRNIFKLLRPTLKLPRRFSSSYVAKFDTQPNKYGGKTNISILPGVGIGPEVMDSTLQVLQAAEAPLSYEILPLPSVLEMDEDDVNFNNALISIRRNRVALKGNIEMKTKNKFMLSRNTALRRTLNLHVYITWIKNFPGLQNKFGHMDTIVIRQNTEGEYLMLEHEPRSGSVENLKITTKSASEKIAEFAFQFAVKNNRKRITIVHNADTQSFGEGLFVNAALNVSKKYPSISVEVKEMRVVCSNSIMNPKEYDMILATNLNGGMISNTMIGMMGGPGLFAGTNVGSNGIAVFEPGARNKGSSIVGTGTANPVAMIFAAINLLKYLGNHKTADIVNQSVYNTLIHDRIRTKDLGGNATTEQITANVVNHIKKLLNADYEHKRISSDKTWKSYCDVSIEEPSKAQSPEKS